MIYSIKNKLSKLTTLKKKTFLSVFLFLLLGLIFPSGAMHSFSTTENLANDFSLTAKQATENGEYVSVLVESDNDKEKPLGSPSREFVSLYGAFRESVVTFAGTVNADKQNDIYIKEIPTSNLSFLYSDVNSNIEYHGHYKHEYYPLELMFKGNHSFENVFSFCYLSESQAKLYLQSKGLELNENNYLSLLGTPITIEINGIDYIFNIANIYYENNYYYDGLKDVMGEFLLSYLRYPDELKKQACYFMRQYPFQNIFYMNRIKALYDPDSFNIKINHFNIITDINDEHLTSFFYAKQTLILDIISIILIVLFSFLTIFLMHFYYSLNVVTDMGTYFLFIGVAFTPYCLFKCLYLITHKIIFLSAISSITNLFAVLFVIICLTIMLMKNCRFKRLGK